MDKLIEKLREAVFQPSPSAQQQYKAAQERLKQRKEEMIATLQQLSTQDRVSIQMCGSGRGFWYSGAAPTLEEWATVIVYEEDGSIANIRACPVQQGQGQLAIRRTLRYIDEIIATLTQGKVWCSTIECNDACLEVLAVGFNFEATKKKLRDEYYTVMGLPPDFDYKHKPKRWDDSNIPKP